MQADIRWLYLAALGVLVSLVSVFAAVEPAAAYSASQTEAQSDPYAFPNVDLCCKPKPPAVPYCSRYPNARRCVCKRDPQDPVCYGYDYNDDQDAPHGGWRRTLVVDCGAASYPGSRVISSLQEAVDRARDGATILVRGGFPGGDCREHVHIEKSLTIVGQGSSPAIVNGCVTVTGVRRSTVTLRNLQILGTTTGLNGTDCGRPPANFTGFDGKLYRQSVLDDHALSALSVAGSTLYGHDLLVRSAQAALDSEQSVVTINNSTLASVSGAGFAVRMDRTEANLTDVVVAGGVTGISAHMLDRHPVRFTRVEVQGARTQAGAFALGSKALVVRVFDEGLPATPFGQASPFSWTGGGIQGFKNAVEVGPGVVSSFSGLRVAAPERGFHVRAGARADLSSNTIDRTEDAAINVERGAAGTATANNITRKRGYCFIVEGDEENDERYIDSKYFTMRGNSCRRESSGFFGG